MGVHDGHRERMRAKFLAMDTDRMEEHELLEMLLYYSTPRKDTNEIAHELINRFGSLRGVIEASPNELMHVDNVKAHSAVLIKLCRAISRRCAAKPTDPKKCYTTSAQIEDYLIDLYSGLGVECVYMMLFDNALRLIDCVKVSEGTVNGANVPLRNMIETALLKHASAVVVAHNHPGGLPVPSGEDIEVSQMMERAFSLMDIPLLEHFVVAENKCASIMKNQRGHFRISPITGESDPSFYRTFYGE